MSILVRLVIGAIFGVFVYVAMRDAGTDYSAAFSTAVLFAGATMPIIDPGRITGSVQDRRRVTFERRLDTSVDHVRNIVTTTVKEHFDIQEKDR